MPASGPAYDVEALRAAEFPALRGVYLNAASVSPLPERTRRAAEEWNARRSRVHEMGADDFLGPLARARSAAARLVGADAEEIALGWNTSYGINLAALSLPVEPGSCIVVSDREFPANVYPWMGREETRFEVVPSDPLGRPDEARILERLDRGDVSIFALSAVQFAAGYRADLRRFGEFCRARGIHFVVDAIQALGQVPLDVRDAQIDVLATGGHKWLLAPYGTGFAYVRRELLERMEPRFVGWTGMSGCADLESLLDYRWELLPDARRFEGGSLPVQDFAGLAVSIELLLEVGVDRIERHLRGILEPLEGWLGRRDDVGRLSEADPARGSGIVAFRPPAAEEAYRTLRGAGVVCSLREGAIRLSPHLYNTREEIERVVDVLDGSAGGV